MSIGLFIVDINLTFVWQVMKIKYLLKVSLSQLEFYTFHTNVEIDLGLDAQIRHEGRARILPFEYTFYAEIHSDIQYI